MRRGTMTNLPQPSARLSRNRPTRSRLLPARAFLALLAVLPGCSTVDSVSDTVLGTSTAKPASGQQGFVSGFLGGVVADEPRAALAGRDALSAGGTAADAAVAVALTLAVTYPSRAGLGGGGACIAYSPNADTQAKGVPEAVMFTPLAPATPGAGADRPAAVPMMARGLFLLHARYGTLPFESLVSPAEQLARSGVPASRALVKDLALVSGPLLADPAARAVFSQNGVPLAEGQMLRQPDLAATLAQIRTVGVGDMYQGALARRIEQASAQIGGPIRFEDLRGALPKLAAPLIRDFRKDKVAFLPPPADGGLAAEAAFDVLANNPDDLGVGRGPLPGRRRPVSRRRHNPGGGAGRDRPAGGRPDAVPGLHQLRDHGPVGQRGGVRADPGQSVRHRAYSAGPRLPGRRLAGRRAAAVAGGRAGVERPGEGLPSRRRRVGAGRRAAGGGRRADQHTAGPAGQ